MEVHAHTHTPGKKWTHYFWEFLMLFLAVFAGFLAENQREHYIEKLRARQFAVSLIADLEKDKISVGVVIEQINELIESIDTLNNFVKGRQIGQIDNFELLVKFPLSGYRPFSWSRATLEQIKNSGSLRYFSNQMLVKKISAYDALTRHLDEDAKGDMERNALVVEKLGNVADLSYAPEILQFLYDLDNFGQRKDSLKTRTLFSSIPDKKKKLLTNEINDVKQLVNISLIQRPNLVTRGVYELPGLIRDADELILFLKKEYRLK